MYRWKKRKLNDKRVTAWGKRELVELKEVACDVIGVHVASEIDGSASQVVAPSAC